MTNKNITALGVCAGLLLVGVAAVADRWRLAGGASALLGDEAAPFDVDRNTRPGVVDSEGGGVRIRASFAAKAFASSLSTSKYSWITHISEPFLKNKSFRENRSAEKYNRYVVYYKNYF